MVYTSDINLALTTKIVYMLEFVHITKRATTDIINRLPYELLHHILWYIDQPSDLFRMSCVCSCWRSFIINDEYVLTQWFSRSLERSRQRYYNAYFICTNDFEQQPMLHIDQSLFPTKLRSSECYLLPWIVPRHSSCYESLFGHYYDSLFTTLSHSFSFWLFLPYQFELNMEIENSTDMGFV